MSGIAKYISLFYADVITYPYLNPDADDVIEAPIITQTSDTSGLFCYGS